MSIGVQLIIENHIFYFHFWKNLLILYLIRVDLPVNSIAYQASDTRQAPGHRVGATGLFEIQVARQVVHFILFVLAQLLNGS